MTQTHTPGPWEAHGCAVYTADQWEDGRNFGGVLIAVAVPSEDNRLPQEADIANAHLIAAAPDLLAALQACEAELAHHVGEDRCQRAVTEAVQITQRAIAKATGGAR